MEEEWAIKYINKEEGLLYLYKNLTYYGPNGEDYNPMKTIPLSGVSKEDLEIIKHGLKKYDDVECIIKGDKLVKVLYSLPEEDT